MATPTSRGAAAGPGKPREMVLPDTIIDTIETGKAAGRGDEAVVLAWLDGGGHVDARHSEMQGTLLMTASVMGHERLVIRLLGKGAAVDLQNTGGSTALLGAAHQGQLSTLRRLLRAGARTDLKPKGGFTALQCAEYKGHADVAQLLREHAAAMVLPEETCRTFYI